MTEKGVARRGRTEAVPVDVGSMPALSLDDIAGEDEAQLLVRGAAYAEEYARIEHKPEILLKNIATVVLAIRRKHDDWLGTSHDYRQQVAEMYRRANIPPDSKSRIQAAVRYHIGNAIREQLTPKELKALELREESPLKRLQLTRATNSAILAASKAGVDADASTPKKKAGAKAGQAEHAQETVPEQGGGNAVKATADHLRLAKVGASVFQQLDVSVIDEHMTDGQRAKLDEQLAELQAIVAKLRRHTRKRKSGA